MVSVCFTIVFATTPGANGGLPPVLTDPASPRWASLNPKGEQRDFVVVTLELILVIQ